jgi:hypothetical protein
MIITYDIDRFKDDLFTEIERMTEDVDSLEGFDCNNDNWWSGEKEIQIDYEDCTAWIKCEIQLNSDWEGCFKSGDVCVFNGGIIWGHDNSEQQFTESEQQELSKYLTW